MTDEKGRVLRGPLHLLTTGEVFKGAISSC